METDAKIGWSILCVFVVSGFVVLSFVFFMPKTFEGYYLCNGRIWASYDWQVDERAFDYTEDMWKYIVENDLHLKRKK